MNKYARLGFPARPISKLCGVLFEFRPSFLRRGLNPRWLNTHTYIHIRALDVSDEKMEAELRTQAYAATERGGLRWRNVARISTSVAGVVEEDLLVCIMKARKTRQSEVKRADLLWQVAQGRRCPNRSPPSILSPSGTIR